MKVANKNECQGGLGRGQLWKLEASRIWKLDLQDLETGLQDLETGLEDLETGRQDLETMIFPRSGN